MPWAYIIQSLVSLLGGSATARLLTGLLGGSAEKAVAKAGAGALAQGAAKGVASVGSKLPGWTKKIADISTPAAVGSAAKAGLGDIGTNLAFLPGMMGAGALTEYLLQPAQPYGENSLPIPQMPTNDYENMLAELADQSSDLDYSSPQLQALLAQFSQGRNMLV